MSQRREHKKVIIPSNESKIREMYKRYKWLSDRMWNAPTEKCEPYQWGWNRNIRLRKSHAFNNAHDTFLSLTPFLNVRMIKIKKDDAWRLDCYRVNLDTPIYQCDTLHMVDIEDYPQVGYPRNHIGVYHPIGLINHLQYKTMNEAQKKWLCPKETRGWVSETTPTWYKWKDIVPADHVWELEITPRMLDYYRIHEPDIVSEHDHLENLLYRKHIDTLRKVTSGYKSEWDNRLEKNRITQNYDIKDTNHELMEYDVDIKVKSKIIPYYK